ncbi:isopentenyldiphosphate isomerase [Allocatelliglobosispora scoriae]|uniref:Isopentenyldiphosphate isomerase n=2 Tax=Allocatelliglobosispora scoriae TaxID=643052 RepID=A0A841C627_9ACTN|nr:isopentenyldiphosphate isomerase [Allocatelliglobosispora scoriae]
MPGERLIDAVNRRLGAELGTWAAQARLVLGSVRYEAEMAGVRENEMGPVLRVSAGSTITPHPDEVQAARWVPWQRLVNSAADDQSRSRRGAG